MPQGQFTKTKHKFRKFKKKKKKRRKIFKNPVNQEILNTHHNHDSRVICPSTHLRVFPFLKYNKTKSQFWSIFNSLPVLQYIFNCDV